MLCRGVFILMRLPEVVRQLTAHSLRDGASFLLLVDQPLGALAIDAFAVLYMQEGRALKGGRGRKGPRLRRSQPYSLGGWFEYEMYIQLDTRYFISHVFLAGCDQILFRVLRKQISGIYSGKTTLQNKQNQIKSNQPTFLKLSTTTPTKRFMTR